MINLGDKVKDKVSGLVGTVVHRTEYLNGCVQYGVQPKLKAKETEIATWSIDEKQLEIVGKPCRVKKSRTGGPTHKVVGQGGYTHVL